MRFFLLRDSLVNRWKWWKCWKWRNVMAIELSLCSIRQAEGEKDCVEANDEVVPSFLHLISVRNPFWRYIQILQRDSSWGGSPNFRHFFILVQFSTLPCRCTPPREGCKLWKPLHFPSSPLYFFRPLSTWVFASQELELCEQLFYFCIFFGL